MRNFQGIVLYEHKHIERFSNLHQCTFKVDVVEVARMLLNFQFLKTRMSRLHKIETSAKQKLMKNTNFMTKTKEENKKKIPEKRKVAVSIRDLPHLLVI